MSVSKSPGIPVRNRSRPPQRSHPLSSGGRKTRLLQRAAAQNATKPVHTDPAFPSAMSPPVAVPIEMGGSGLSLFFQKAIGSANAGGFKQVGEGHFESDGNHTRYWRGETDSPPATQLLRMEQIDDDTYELSNNTQLK